MKKGDIVWLSLLLLALGFVLSPYTHEIFLSLTKNHPFISGFCKFALLATMGELLAIRIVQKEYIFPKGFVARVIIWGLLGAFITLLFYIFAYGIKDVLAKGYLLGGESKYAFALWVSVIMNLVFAPSFMAFHRFTDTYIDLFYEGRRDIKIVDVTKAIDWNGFISFIVVKTIPLFWIPAHFFTFLLPSEYRVFVAALLSIALGGILAFGKRR